MDWTGIDAGVQGLRRGLDWAQENEMRSHRVRRERDQAGEERILAEEAQRAVTPQPAAPAQAPGGGAQAAVTPVVDDDPGYAAQQQDVEAYRRLSVSGASALGGQAENPDVRRDTATGAGMVPPNVLLAAVRRASGNTDQPLGRTDYLAYVEAVSQRMAREGLGHRVADMRGRVLQSFHSAAARTMAIASAMADSGDLQGAARAVATAYDFVPDGSRMTFSQGEGGVLLGQRVGASGQPVGEPMPITAESIREIALQAQDPMQYAGLLLAREQQAIRREVLNESIRHNRAVEGLSAQRIAAAGARAGGRGGATPTPLSVSDYSSLGQMIEPTIDEAIAAATAAVPNTNTRYSPPTRNAVLTGAIELARTGAIAPQATAPIAAGILSGTIPVHPGSDGQFYARTPHGLLPLSPAFRNLVASMATEPPAVAEPQAPGAVPGLRRNQAPPANLPR